MQKFGINYTLTKGSVKLRRETAKVRGCINKARELKVNGKEGSLPIVSFCRDVSCLFFCYLVTRAKQRPSATSEPSQPHLNVILNRPKSIISSWMIN